MGAVFGHRWATSYSRDPAGLCGDTWAAGLAGMTGEQLARGLRHCANSPDGWPPSLPEFRAACLGVPAFGDVVRELRPGAPDVSAFSRLVQTWVDPFQLRQADARLARQLIREAYDECARFVLSVGEIPEPRLRISDADTREREYYDNEHFKRFLQFE